MIDIVEQLREDAAKWHANSHTGDLAREAADEIERLRTALYRLTMQRRQDIEQLRAENERLQAALSKAIDELSYTDLRASGGIAKAP